MQKNQAPELVYLRIGDAAKLLGWSVETVRRNLDRFQRYPGPTALSRTPGGHIRILRDAVIYVLGQGAEPVTADELLKDLR